MCHWHHCLHRFFAHHLDHLSCFYQVGGTSYIPCPIANAARAATPTLGCMTTLATRTSGGGSSSCALSPPVGLGKPPRQCEARGPWNFKCNSLETTRVKTHCVSSIIDAFYDIDSPALDTAGTYITFTDALTQLSLSLHVKQQQINVRHQLMPITIIVLRKIND